MSSPELKNIPFSRPYLTGRETVYVQEALLGDKLSGNGPMTKFCQSWLEKQTGSARVLLTQSCTSALEMAALLLDLKQGDEVILPSFTFSTTASAFVLRGAVPVFVDIRSDTLNINESLLEGAITSRTRAIVPVHYAGVGCDMSRIMSLAGKYDLMVIEDAAQGLMASVEGKALGSIGQLGALSFHDTKNIISGEGGALLVNDPALISRAEILWEKGTNRSQFLRGQVDKYTWVDLGSSFLPSEVTAAVLRAQLEAADQITSARMAVWKRYFDTFEDLERAGRLKRPTIPSSCVPNAHIFYVLLEGEEERNSVLTKMNSRGVGATFHYVPLHSSPAGRKFGKTGSEMTCTDDISARLLRLPLFPMEPAEQDRVISEFRRAIFANEK